MFKRLLFLLLVGCGVFLGLHHTKAAQYDYAYVGQVNPSSVGKVGQSYQVSLTIRNTGTATWLRDSSTPFRLGTQFPQDGYSQMCPGTFFTTGWLPGCNRIQLPIASVAPGQTVTIPFTLSNPDIGGRFTQYLRPVVDYVQWLPQLGIYFTNLAPAKAGVLMFNWYGPNGQRWGNCGPGCGQTVDTPHFGSVHGYYDSADLTVRRQQLQLIQDAGFDYVILDFWIDSNGTLDPTQTRLNAYAAAHLIQAEFPNLQFSFLVESLAQSSLPHWVHDDIDLNFPSKAGFFTYGHIPTIYTWGILQPSYDARFNQWWWSDSTGANTMYWLTEPLLTKNGAVTIFPSFNVPNNDPNQTGTWWAQQFGEAMNYREGARQLLIYGWNEYYERSQIEPHDRYGTTNAPDNMYQRVKSSLAQWHN